MTQEQAQSRMRTTRWERSFRTHGKELTSEEIEDRKTFGYLKEMKLACEKFLKARGVYELCGKFEISEF